MHQRFRTLSLLLAKCTTTIPFSYSCLLRHSVTSIHCRKYSTPTTISNASTKTTTPTQIHSKIQDKIDPVLEFFGIVPSGNIFIDMQKLAEAIESDKIDNRVIKMFFDYYDRDENGGIDRQEFHLLIRDLGKAISNKALENVNAEDAELIFNTLDIDRNNLISIDEFSVWWRELMQQ